jgi:hypothetical protein
MGFGSSISQALTPTARPHAFVQQDYLTGVRGLLTVQSFLWVFLTTFAPATVAHSANQDGPLYQTIIRKTLSVLFWNDALIYSSFIFLSARTACLPFLADKSSQSASSTLFRRGIRLWFPTAVAFALSTLIFSQSGTAYISDFMTRTGNTSISPPRDIPSFLNWFNSLFEIFWVNKRYSLQAANTAFPSQTLWIISLVFQQSFTVYMTMVTIPHTRDSWRVKAFLAFIITAWWVQSWAWYSISGLLLADAVVNMNLREKMRRGFRIPNRPFAIPVWILYGVLLLAGLLMQYLWVAWRPEYRNAELKGHTGLYNAGPMNSGFDVNGPQARDDNFLVILGFFLCLEHFEGMQRVLRSSVFQYFGKRSLSKSHVPGGPVFGGRTIANTPKGFFLMQSIIIFSAGIKLFNHLRFGQNMTLEVSSFLCLLVCAPLVALTTEVFYRAVDYPSTAFAHLAFDWIRT